MLPPYLLDGLVHELERLRVLDLAALELLARHQLVHLVAEPHHARHLQATHRHHSTTASQRPE